MAHWSELLRPTEPRRSPQTIRVQTVTRGGRDWLVLPHDRRLAARALTLYPAQRRMARLAKRLLAIAVRIKSPLREQTLELDTTAPFVEFLRRVAATRSSVPQFAVLSGNPNVVGRRYVLLLFDDAGQPTTVVKAGTVESARALIRSEMSFLSAHPEIPGITPLLETFESGRATAFATPFVPGESPAPGASAGLAKLLVQWMNPTDRLPIAELPPWRRLAAACADTPLMKTLTAATSGRLVHPVIWHGDLAPWNIRQTPGGEWVVFDWESSETAGVPGWNWIHYVVSSGVLIERLTERALVSKLERLLTSEPFRAYLAAAGADGIEREIALAYLLYRKHVRQPAERAEEIFGLLDAMSATP